MLDAGPVQHLKTSHSTERNQQNSPLLHLPPELRNKVYDFILDLGFKNITHDNFNTWERFNFMFSCKRIYAETANNYYAEKLDPLHRKTLFFNTGAGMQHTIKNLLPSQRRLIRAIRFACSVLGELGIGLAVDFLVENVPNLGEVGIELPKGGLMPADDCVAVFSFWLQSVKRSVKIELAVFSPDRDIWMD